MAVGASEAARWQAYQTGARMGAHLWFQIITVVIMAWLALAMSVISYETGTYYPDLRHAYFWRWVICGIMTDTALLNLFAPRLKVPAGGSWYPLPQLTDWMNSRQVYHASFPSWFAHFAPRTALVPLALAVLAMAWRARHSFDAEHLRSLRLLAPGIITASSMGGG